MGVGRRDARGFRENYQFPKQNNRLSELPEPQLDHAIVGWDRNGLGATPAFDAGKIICVILSRILGFLAEGKNLPVFRVGWLHFLAFFNVCALAATLAQSSSHKVRISYLACGSKGFSPIPKVCHPVSDVPFHTRAFPHANRLVLEPPTYIGYISGQYRSRTG